MSRGREPARCSRDRADRSGFVYTVVPLPRSAIGSKRSEALDIKQGPRAHEVIISRIELDEMIDGLNRAVNATAACGEWCQMFAKQAAKAFEDEKNALQATRATLERFRRA